MTVGSPPRAPFKLWVALVASAVGGVAFDASFPSFGVWPLAFVAIALALVSLIGRRGWGAFAVGATFGAAFFFPHIDWAAHFLGDHPLRWVPWAALAGVETVFVAVGSVAIALAYRWSAQIIARPHWRFVATSALVAGIWTARELVMGSWPYGGFPWGRVGMSQSESPLAPVASWVGVTGLTFLIVLVVALTIEGVRWARSARGDGSRAWWSLAAPAGLLAVLIVVPQFPTVPAGTMRVAAVQGNGPAAYVDEHARYEVLDAQLRASEAVIGEGADVIVWPEGGVGVDPTTDERAATVLDAAAESYDAPILLNAAVGEGDLVYNMSMLWRDGGAEQTHSKRYPVPFGEYVPNREFFEAIVPSLISMIGREYTPGTDSPTMTIGDATVGLAICFDVLYDQHIGEAIDDGAQAFMFQTNNADFRGTDENLQQLAFARMRAIETGRSVVNVSTVGTSQVIRPDGSTIEQIGVDEAGAIITEIELRDGATPATWAGGWIRGFLLWIPLVVTAVLGAIVDRMRRIDQAE